MSPEKASRVSGTRTLLWMVVEISQHALLLFNLPASDLPVNITISSASGDRPVCVCVCELGRMLVKSGSRASVLA